MKNPDTSLERQREMLRRELQMQRLIVDRALAEASGLINRPRSQTMRFLQKHSTLARLLGHSLQMLLTVRLIK
jgi:hypothetical protein